MTQLRTYYSAAVKIDNQRMKTGFTLDAISSSGNPELIKKVSNEFDSEKRRDEIEKIKENLRARRKF